MKKLKKYLLISYLFGLIFFIINNFNFEFFILIDPIIIVLILNIPSLVIGSLFYILKRKLFWIFYGITFFICLLIWGSSRDVSSIGNQLFVIEKEKGVKTSQKTMQAQKQVLYTIQDYLCELRMKPRMHLLEVIIFFTIHTMSSSDLPKSFRPSVMVVHRYMH